MVKTPKQFRLSDETIGRISWLQEDLELDATKVVSKAVRALYDERRKARLVEGDESWILEMSGRAFAQGTNDIRDQLATMAPDELERMREGMPEGNAMVMMMLAVAKLDDPKSRMVVTDDYIEHAARMIKCEEA